MPCMNLSALQRHYLSELTPVYGHDEALAIFWLVLEHYLHIDKVKFYMNKDLLLSINDLNNFEEVLNKLKEGEPVQYITGEAEFYGLKFKVSEAVLIPRPETEELIEWILHHSRESGNMAPKVLDIGTGSGCIAISLKKQLPHANVYAIDVSADALEVARQNAVNNAVDVNFIQKDILGTIDRKNYEGYDIIVSNPPYITRDEATQMHANVLNHEPEIALFVNNDPLLFYKAIAAYAEFHLKSNGSLFFEINQLYGKETIDMLSNKGFINNILKKDMQGKDRMILSRT